METKCLTANHAARILPPEIRAVANCGSFSFTLYFPPSKAYRILFVGLYVGLFALVVGAALSEEELGRSDAITVSKSASDRIAGAAIEEDCPDYRLEATIQSHLQPVSIVETRLGAVEKTGL